MRVLSGAAVRVLEGVGWAVTVCLPVGLGRDAWRQVHRRAVVVTWSWVADVMGDGWTGSHRSADALMGRFGEEI